MIEVNIQTDGFSKKVIDNIYKIKEIINNEITDINSTTYIYYNSRSDEFTQKLTPGNCEVRTKFDHSFLNLEEDLKVVFIYDKLVGSYVEVNQKILSGNIDSEGLLSGDYSSNYCSLDIIYDTLKSISYINLEKHHKLYEINVDINNYIEKSLIKYYKKNDDSNLQFLLYFNYREVFGDVLTDHFFEKLLTTEYIDKIGASDSLVISSMCRNSNVDMPYSIEEYLNNKLLLAY